MHMHHHNTGGIAIDSYACNSRLRHISAGFKAGFSMLLLLFCIFADHPVISVLLILFAASVTVFLGGIPLHDYLSVLGIPVFFCAAWRHRHRCRSLFTADWRFLPESVFLLPLCHVCRHSESVFSDAESVRCRKLHVPNDTFHTVTRTFRGSP